MLGSRIAASRYGRPPCMVGQREGPKAAQRVNPTRGIFKKSVGLTYHACQGGLSHGTQGQTLLRVNTPSQFDPRLDSVPLDSHEMSRGSPDGEHMTSLVAPAWTQPLCSYRGQVSWIEKPSTISRKRVKSFDSIVARVSDARALQGYLARKKALLHGTTMGALGTGLRKGLRENDTAEWI